MFSALSLWTFGATIDTTDVLGGCAMHRRMLTASMISTQWMPIVHWTTKMSVDIANVSAEQNCSQVRTADSTGKGFQVIATKILNWLRRKISADQQFLR